MTINIESQYLELVDGSLKTTIPFPLRELILNGDNVIITGQDNEARILLYSDITGYASASDLYDAIQASAAVGRYKVYRALLSQSAPAAPTAIVLENTLGEVPTYLYSAGGDYSLNTVGNVFTTNKTLVFLTLNSSAAGSDGATFLYSLSGEALIGLKTFEKGGSLSDDLLYFASIQIFVYP